ncbi:hypothetical protein BJ322DRAFT_402007 [Thelephora terrestris]|jgi:hypothetical protein|uniref:DUF6699 domain-containing protein n=1 Tax=Thelephora terrestris TaxID=56493 RepID=A0A9P6LAA1_9AGAM|nr:hypothetical protein BJ322DRAFT_402007 [Thelephora terrestris]
MSGPFVYTPTGPSYQDFGSSPYTSQFFNRQRVSPHIPTVNLNDPSAPNTPIRGSRILDDDPWTSPRPRSRRPSWHAGMSSPFIGAPSLPVPDDFVHTRRRSFDNRYQRPNVDYYQSQQPNPYPWMTPGTPMPTAVPGPSYSYTGYPPVVPSELHPLLRPDSHAIYFDLSFFEFRPLDAKGRPIPAHTLAEPATHPPTTRLVITSDRIPQWPILLDYYAATAGTARSPSMLPPITLGDVLTGIHETMQTQITHREWAELSDTEETAVGKAYVKRYKLVPGYETRIAADGVRRIDYLLKRVMFAGLTRKSGDQGYENLKIHFKSK